MNAVGYGAVRVAVPRVGDSHDRRFLQTPPECHDSGAGRTPRSHVLLNLLVGHEVIRAKRFPRAECWQNGRCTYSGNYFFWIESGSSGAYEYDNVFRGINFEVCNGGGIKGLGAFNWTVDNCWLYDNFLATQTSKDFLYFGESTHGSAPLKSRSITISNTGSRTPSYNGAAVDIKLAGDLVGHTEVDGVMIINCGGPSYSGADQFSIDCGENLGVVITGGRALNITNQSLTTIVMQNYSSATTGLQIGGSIIYGYDNTLLDRAKVTASAGTLFTGAIFPPSMDYLNVPEGGIFVEDSDSTMLSFKLAFGRYLPLGTRSWFINTEDITELVPHYRGEFAYKQSTNKLYISVGLTSADWVQLN